MKITLQKEALEAATKIVSGTVSTSDRGIQGHYVFRQKDGEVAVYTSSGRLFSSAPLQCEVDTQEDGDFTIESKRLNKWLRTVDGQLSLGYKSGVITAAAMLGEVKFRSLDTSLFPWWDANLASATKTVTIESERLAEVLNYVRPFCSTNDTMEANLCSTEVVDSSFLATDNKGLVVVSVRGFEESNLRVWAKEIGSVSRFLGSVEGDVEILEHTSCFILRSEGGEVFGQARPEQAFPEITMNPKMSYEGADAHWVFCRDDMKRAIDFLSVSAQEEDFAITLKQAGDLISLEMKAAAGGVVSISVDCPEHTGKDGIEFSAHFEKFTKMLSQVSDEPVKMAVQDMGSGKGYYSFHESDSHKTQFYMIGVFYAG